MTYLPWIICAFLLMVCIVADSDLRKARKALRDAEEEIMRLKGEFCKQWDEKQNALDNVRMHSELRRIAEQERDDLITQRDHLLQRLQSNE
jgi:hypothetical protein